MLYKNSPINQKNIFILECVKKKYADPETPGLDAPSHFKKILGNNFLFKFTYLVRQKFEYFFYSITKRSVER